VVVNWNEPGMEILSNLLEKQNVLVINRILPCLYSNTVCKYILKNKKQAFYLAETFQIPSVHLAAFLVVFERWITCQMLSLCQTILFAQDL
jgi:hypothetical protein